MLFTYNTAYAYFGVGDFKTALKYINEVLNDNEKMLRQDIYSFSRIFNLVIHFELNNHDFLEYDMKSTARYLNKHAKDYEVEKLFMKEMKGLSRVDDDDERRKLFTDFSQKLTKLLKIDRENVILEYFDLRAWLRSKVEGIDFEEAVSAGMTVMS